MECRAYGICLDSQSRGYLGKDRKVSSAAGGNLSRMHKTQETAKESRLNFMYSHLRNGTLVVLLELLLAKDPVRRFQTPAELLKVMPTVRDAINAGRALIKTIRVFVSSTGDVQKERHVAERVMRSIAAEFNLPVSASCSIFQRLTEED